ncbi:MAG: hypothetical protein R2715_13945 [Ilumatobacteraceae bacterium]
MKLAYVQLREDDLSQSPDTVQGWLDNGYAIFPEARHDQVTWNYDHADSPWHVAFTPGVRATDVVRDDGTVLVRDGVAQLVDPLEVRAKAAELKRPDSTPCSDRRAPTMKTLSRTEARRIAVRAQLLDRPRPVDLLAVAERLTLLQLDPTAAIAPAADLVLVAARQRLPTRAAPPGGRARPHHVRASGSTLAEGTRHRRCAR